MGGAVNWDITDFLVFGALLASVAGCFLLVLTGFFTALWLASALLFRKRYLHP